MQNDESDVTHNATGEIAKLSCVYVYISGSEMQILYLELSCTGV